VSANPNDQLPGPGYAAPKPTVDEILASVARHNKTSTDFLKADIEVALTFAGIARAADNSKERERNRRAARKAYDTAVRMIGRVDLTDHDARVLGRSLARLKSELRGLGEII
jgi:GAF domain-containing protein